MFSGIGYCVGGDNDGDGRMVMGDSRSRGVKGKGLVKVWLDLVLLITRVGVFFLWDFDKKMGLEYGLGLGVVTTRNFRPFSKLRQFTIHYHYSSKHYSSFYYSSLLRSI